SPAYMDTTVRFVSNFLYRQMGCTPRDPSPDANTWNTVSVNEFQKADNSVEVFPNPATDQFAIRSLQLTNGRVEINNSVGEKIFESEFNRQVTIDSKKFPGGIYFVRLSNSEKQFIKKLVIE